METRTLRVLSGRDEYPLPADSDIGRIAGTYHAWRGEGPMPSLDSGLSTLDYHDIPGFCKSARLEEIQKHGHVLTPGRYVGAADVEDDGEPFEEKMQRMTAELEACFSESDRLQESIRSNIASLGFGMETLE